MKHVHIINELKGIEMEKWEWLLDIEIFLVVSVVMVI